LAIIILILFDDASPATLLIKSQMTDNINVKKTALNYLLNECAMKQSSWTQLWSLCSLWNSLRGFAKPYKLHKIYLWLNL